MIIINALEGLQARSKPILLAAGFFDGLHLGHRRVLDHALACARRVDGEVWVLSFDIHPLKVLKPERAPLLLTSTEHKLALMRQVGIDGCVLLPFSRALAATSAEAFVQRLLDGAPTLRAVVVGENWRFGAGAKGTPALLAGRAVGAGVAVTTIPPYLHAGEVVSSSRIRHLVTSGDLASAAAMLGRPFSVLGTVVHGRAIGRTMGYPSANIDPHNEALPPLGVYAVQARVGDRFHAGALNFGTRPTFEKDAAVPPLLELHLLDFSGCLYAQDIEAFFIERLRDEWYFATIAELKAQIDDDVARTRRVLAASGLSAEQKQMLCRGWEQPVMVGDTELESVTSCV